MSTGGKKSEGQPPKAKSAPVQGPSRMVRIVASIALAFHVFVLFLYPLANSRTSETMLRIANWGGLRWYAEPLYLHHGHGFFGPDPGPSFTVEYTVEDADGKVIKEGSLPDLKEHWPRLLYHRYKMLADQVETPNPLIEERRPFILQRYAQQLVRQYDGERATVTEKFRELVPREQWLGNPDENIKGRSLTDVTLDREIMRITQTRADVDAADARLLGDAEETPTPERPLSQPEPIGIPQ